MGEGHDGLFIVFEGIDGSGTTTQATRYAEYLKGKRRMVHLTREPSGGPTGSLLRLMLAHRVTLPGAYAAEAMALLFAADRLDHLGSEVEPLLHDGAVVLSDRYDLSSLAYQTATSADGSEAMITWVRTLNRIARRPTATVVIDVKPEVAETRRKHRGGGSELYDDVELQKRLTRAYAEAELLVPGDHVLHVDGNQSIEDVHSAVVRALAPIVERPSAAPPGG